MQRTPLFRGSTPTGVPWHDRMVDAVRKGDAATVIQLVGQPDGVRRLREGFRVVSVGDRPFAKLCLLTSSVPVLRALVEAAPNGVTLQDCCTLHVERNRATISSDMDLHFESVSLAHPSAQALALAIELQPDHPCLRLPNDHDGSDGSATLHYQALQQTTWLASGRWGNSLESSKLAKVREFAACAKLLRQTGIPVDRRNIAASPASLLFSGRWHQDERIAEVLVDLIEDYVAAGWIDIDAPAVAGGLTPLWMAITAGNGPAAAVAIDLGCDLGPGALRGRTDVLELVHLHGPSDVARSVEMRITDALLRRRLRELDGAPPVAPAAAALRRPRRAVI